MSAMSCFAMSLEELDEVFDTVACLAGRPRRIEELSGGLTNRNVKVTTPEGVFVARCTDLRRNALDIDRDAEHLNSRAAEHAGVGAPVLEHRPDLGVLVVGFLPGRTLSSDDVASDAMVPRVAEACRRLHGGPRFVSDFDMFERQRRYLRTAQDEGCRLPPGYVEMADRLARARAALDVLDEGTVPCNNDLLAENFVDDGERLWLIDYEYSGNNDACFELGNIWMESRLSLDQLELLVTSYYGRPRPNRLARARLLGAVGAHGWTLWGLVQDAVSAIDFDYRSWALERHELAMAELTADGFPELLDAVRRPDPPHPRPEPTPEGTP